MPEYFEISILSPESINNNKEIYDCLVDLGLTELKIHTEYFDNKEIVVEVFHEYMLLELIISIPYPVFTKDNFEDELDKLTSFVSIFFEKCPSVVYALCSYELNTYYLNGVDSIDAINKEISQKFPIIYHRNSSLSIPEIKLNIESQYIF